MEKGANGVPLSITPMLLHFGPCQRIKSEPRVGRTATPTTRLVTRPVSGIEVWIIARPVQCITKSGRVGLSPGYLSRILRALVPARHDRALKQEWRGLMRLCLSTYAPRTGVVELLRRFVPFCRTCSHRVCLSEPPRSLTRVFLEMVQFGIHFALPNQSAALPCCLR